MESISRRSSVRGSLAAAAGNGWLSRAAWGTAPVDLEVIGKVRPRPSARIAASPLGVGFETLDRQMFDPERDPAVRSQTEEAMLQAAEFAAEKRVFQATKRKPTVRQIGETALAQLMFGDLAFTPQERTELAGAIVNAEYAVDPSAAYCLLGAYWKARTRGFFQP